MKVRLPAGLLALIFALATVLIADPTFAQGGTPPPTVDAGELPEGAVFEPVNVGTEGDFLAVSERIAVTRVIQEPEAVTTRAIRHPTVFLVESGELGFVAGDASGEESAMLLRASDGGDDARIVTPGSQLSLAPGDRLVIPPTPPDFDPDYVSFANQGDEPINYLEVEIFPSGRPAAALFEGLDGFTVQPMDVTLGLPTAQEPAPPTISVGRLTLAPGMRLPLDVIGPALLLIESGALTVAPEDGQLPVERAGVDYDDVPEMVAAGEGATTAGGDAIFIAPDVSGEAITPNDVPASILVVSVTALST